MNCEGTKNLLDNSQDSAIHHFETLVEEIGARNVAIFLDYDGTLTPIIEDPDAAFIPDKTAETLKKVASSFKMGIITGRSLEKIQGFLQLDDIYYAGSHGLDIIGPSLRHQVGEEYQIVIRNLKIEIAKNLKATQGLENVMIESTNFTLSVHYRTLDPAYHQALRTLVDAILEEHRDEVKLCHGKMVYEIRPIVKWAKGDALEFLYRNIMGGSPEHLFPIYIGDDVSDEDAFHALQTKIKCGAGILVADEQKPTFARYVLNDPFEVENFLARFLNMKPSSGTSQDTQIVKPS